MGKKHEITHFLRQKNRKNVNSTVSTTDKCQTKKGRLPYSDGVGECQGDSERKSFRNSDDENGDTDDEELDELLDVRNVPRRSFDGKLLDTKPNHQNENRQDRHSRSCRNKNKHIRNIAVQE